MFLFSSGIERAVKGESFPVAMSLKVRETEIGLAEFACAYVLREVQQIVWYMSTLSVLQWVTVITIFILSPSLFTFGFWLTCSPEQKAQVSFSDQNLSVVCLHHCCCLVVVIVVNFSNFHLLLQNQWANFNQTWHKASLDEGDSCLFKLRVPSFSKGK